VQVTEHSSELENLQKELSEISGTIQRHRVAVKSLITRRNQLIRSLHARGMTEREIAVLARMTGPRVNEVRHGG
jgi:hypothetical protein